MHEWWDTLDARSRGRSQRDHVCTSLHVPARDDPTGPPRPRSIPLIVRHASAQPSPRFSRAHRRRHASRSTSSGSPALLAVACASSLGHSRVGHHNGVPRRQLNAGRREVRTSPRHRHGLHARGRPPLCSHDRLPTDPPLLQVCPRLPALRMPAGTPPPLAPACALLSAPVRRQEHPHSLCSRRAPPLTVPAGRPRGHLHGACTVAVATTHHCILANTFTGDSRTPWRPQIRA